MFCVYNNIKCFNSFMNCYLLLYVIVPLRDSVLFCSVLFVFFISLSFLFFLSLITILLLNDSGLTCVVYCRFETSGKQGRYSWYQSFGLANTWTCRKLIWVYIRESVLVSDIKIFCWCIFVLLSIYEFWSIRGTPCHR